MGFKCGIVGLPNVGKSTLFNALTETAAAQAANYPFCTIEPNVGEIAVPDARLDKLAVLGKSARDHSDPHRLRRYRRPGARRLERRGARQPIPRHHPRSRRHRSCCALFRGQRHHPCRGQDRSDRRHRDHRNRADAGRSRILGKTRRQSGEKGQGHRRGGQRGQGGARSHQTRAGAAARGQAGAPGRAQVRGGKAVPLARAADLGARALCLQRRGSLRRHRQCVLAQGRSARQGGGRGRGGDLGQDRVGDRGAAGRPSARNFSMRSACRRRGSIGSCAPAMRCCIW